MKMMEVLKIMWERFLARWFVCRITSGRKSAQYGIRFSYPLHISLIGIGVFLADPFILSVTALIALLGILLPMHPFDYLYNYVVAKLIGTSQIPGRGSELQVTSTVALLFNLSVLALITYGVQLNYQVMATAYILSSIFFIRVQLRN